MKISHFLSKYRFSLLLSLVFSGVSAAITLTLLSQINSLINYGLKEDHFRVLLAGAGWLVALLIVSLVSQFVLTKLGGELVGSMRTELSQQFIDIEFEKLANRKHLIFGSLIEDIGRIAPLILLVPQLVYQGLLVVLYSAYLATISVRLFGILLLFLAFTLTVTMALGRLMESHFDALRSAEEDVFEGFRSISEGKKEMSLNAQRTHHFTAQVLGPAVTRAQALMVSAHRYIGFNNAWSMTISYGVIFFLAYLGYAAFHLSGATIAQFVVVALFLVSPVGFLTQAAQQVGTGMASMRHLDKIGIELRSEADNQASRYVDLLATTPWQRIQAKAMCYRYPPENGSEGYELGPIDLDIRSGETIFLTGGNGSGKSTLLLLLCGLLGPSRGQLLIDGRPVKDELLAYRDRFSGIFGDFFLFPDVIDKSGRSLPDESIQELLQKLNLKTKVSVGNGRLSKLSLSTGQRKRLALLQCYAEDREICFFDEWAADQDVHFREYFYYVLLPQLKKSGKTLLVISHDDRYFHIADRILKLEAGRIVADVPGNPDQIPSELAAPADA